MKPNTPIREYLISKIVAVALFANDKQNDHISFDDHYELTIKNEFTFNLWCRLEDIMWSLWNLFYPGSESEWEFHQDFPPYLHPEYHDLPPFGSYPLALIK